MADPQVIDNSSVIEPLAQALFESLQQAGLAVTLKDVAQGCYLAGNQAADEWFGRSLAGVTDIDLMDGVQAAALRAADQQALAAGYGVRAEHKLELPAGRRECVAWRRPVTVADKLMLLTVWQDVSETRRRDVQLQTALEQLEAQQKANAALHRELEGNQVRDTVSGLYQRAHFEEQLRREADLSSREQREFALVSVAVDNMDEVLRLHGAEGCERVIEALGRLLRANTRAMDSPCRLGGDRFVVLLSGVGLATAHSRMEHLRRQCAQHVVPYNGQQIPFTVSMGVASFPHTAGIVEELLRSADRAMAGAREKGGNRIVLASIQFAPAT
jgi:diguanylate cyclase (GGDEF)-like protein